ncbi:MAG: glycosyltransferase family 39 protein [Bacteroidia bacterium]|nr:glycosyltransferase family 39 protein [Bacteroidia bacterium]
MDKVFGLLFQKKFLIILLVMNVILFCISLWHRYIYIDDAWFGEQAYSFAKFGFVKTLTIPGFLGWDRHLFVYHKLNIMMGAAVISLFGFSVYYLKCISLVFFLVFLWSMFRYQKTLSKSKDENNLFLIFLLVIVNPLIVEYSYTFRTEIPMMFFGFISFWSLENFLADGKSKWTALSGISSGLAFLVHLNGIAIVAAGFIYLVLKKKFRGLVVYTITSVLTCSLYFYDLWQKGNFHTFIFQMTHWPDNVAQSYSSHGIWSLISNVVVKMTEEHQRFFWSPNSAVFSVLFFIILISCFKFLWKEYRNLLTYTFVLIFSMNVFGSHIAERYLLTYVPFMILIIAAGLHHYKELQSKTAGIMKPVLVVVIIALFAVTGMKYARIYSLNDNYPVIYHRVLSNIKDQNARILVPYEFVFNELPAHDLVSYQAIKYYQGTLPKMLTQQEMLEKINSMGIDYIVIDKYLPIDDYFTWFYGGVIHENPWYKEFYREKDFIILQRKT